MPATTEKPPSLARELAALERMTAAELRDKYAAVFGPPLTRRPGVGGPDCRQSTVRRRVIIPTATALGRGDRRSLAHRTGA